MDSCLIKFSASEIAADFFLATFLDETFDREKV